MRGRAVVTPRGRDSFQLFMNLVHNWSTSSDEFSAQLVNFIRYQSNVGIAIINHTLITILIVVKTINLMGGL